jgi:hypothetical protein
MGSRLVYADGKTRDAKDRCATQALLAKLKNMPQVEGQPDFSGIGDPKEVAKQWAAEVELGQEELLDQLLSIAESEDNSKT